MTKSAPAYLSSKFSHSNQESKLRLFYLVLFDLNVEHKIHAVVMLLVVCSEYNK